MRKSLYHLAVISIMVAVLTGESWAEKVVVVPLGSRNVPGPPDLYVVESDPISIANGTWKTGNSPTCPSGYRLTAGGYQWSHWDSSGVNVIGSNPNDTGYNTATFWRVLIRNETGSDRTFSVYGMCLRTPGS